MIGEVAPDGGGRYSSVRRTRGDGLGAKRGGGCEVAPDGGGRYSSVRRT